ncbi:hypothetical protein VTG60DRAFT_1593 [Thermothelomyces hinnuleus]
MPPALALGRALSRGRGLQTRPKPASTCLFCSLARPFPRPATTTTARTTAPLRSRERTSLGPWIPRLSGRCYQSTESLSSDPRADLRRALLDLQTHAPNHVNLPRLQLALRNLSEPTGRESIRVAVLSVSSDGAGGSSGTSTTTSTAKRLLRLALADPLRPAAAWEARLEERDAIGDDAGPHPLIVRVVGADKAGRDATAGAAGEGEEEEEEEGLRTVLKEHVIPELRVSTPLLRDAELEMLVADAGDALTAAAAASASSSGAAVDDAVLVPTVDVAATTAGHVAPIGTPVHMALLVGDGVRGAASILALPVLEGRDVVMGAVNFKGLRSEDAAGCPLVAVNVDAASEGLELFRSDVSNAMKYEALWTEANIGPISEWLRKSALPDGEGVTKAPVRNLVSSLLRSARTAVQEEEARDLAAELRTKVQPESIAHLDRALADWAQSAHQELQQQLDTAFATGPWSKLGWWKLVWRADDVGMVTSEMVAQRFLPQAEQGLIYLAGRIQEAGVAEGQQGAPLYPGPALPGPSAAEHTGRDSVAPGVVSKWPSHIPFTRHYLQTKTVPALQALAQKLVVQSASLAGLSTALTGLSYLSGFGAYECGAIAALGIVLSCRRLQQKWDAAREYWEGEVREEGRKAIRATEASVAEVLDKAARTPDPAADQGAQLKELRKAEEIITRAEEALARMK